PAEDADRAAAVVVEPRDQGKERRLARAVEAEQHGAVATVELEGDVAQRLTLAEGMAQPRDDERWGWRARRTRCSLLRGVCRETHRCALTASCPAHRNMPQRPRHDSLHGRRRRGGGPDQLPVTAQDL